MKKIICALCNKPFNKNSLVSHLISIHKWTLFDDTVASKPEKNSPKCPICQVFLRNNHKLKAHILKIHSSINSTATPKKYEDSKILPTISYNWALQQKLDSKYNSLMKEFINNTSLSTIEKKIKSIINDYPIADPSKRKSMSHRLIILSHAKMKIERQGKPTKNHEHNKEKKRSFDIMDQYIGGKKVVISGGLPSLGKR
ncbi:hypothetical protein ACIPR9_20110 [Pectobacterium punjabense]|uniref:hypothetical protein n=1 Tax=Pectobacterium punjabense TaxID=2108399 RepID=UPI00381D92D4